MKRRIRQLTKNYQWDRSLLVALKRLWRSLFHDHLWKQEWEIVHYSRDGQVLYREIALNDLADEGEKQMLEVYFRAENAPTEFYIRLFNDTPAETDALSDLTGEPSGNGYSAKLVERSSIGFPTIELNSGDWRVITKTVQFVASGGSIGPVTYAVLATTSDNSGKLVGYLALSQSRTLADGEKLDVLIRIKQA